MSDVLTSREQYLAAKISSMSDAQRHSLIANLLMALEGVGVDAEMLCEYVAPTNTAGTIEPTDSGGTSDTERIADPGSGSDFSRPDSE